MTVDFDMTKTEGAVEGIWGVEESLEPFFRCAASVVHLELVISVAVNVRPSAIDQLFEEKG